MLEDYDVGTAARTAWLEARSDHAPGENAVANVIVNRLRDGRWGGSLTEVCWAAGQFSCWHPLDRNGWANLKACAQLTAKDEGLATIATMVDAAMKPGNVDPTHGATHYFAEYLSPPAWVEGATFCGQIGAHLFYKDVK